jgi:hypothetical protein
MTGALRRNVDVCHREETVASYEKLQIVYLVGVCARSRSSDRTAVVLATLGLAMRRYSRSIPAFFNHLGDRRLVCWNHSAGLRHSV